MNKYKTVRGFLSKGDDEPAEIVIKYAAAIRIGGNSFNLDGLDAHLNIMATHKHRKGEKMGDIEFSDDMWLYETTRVISEYEPFETHLNHMNKIFLPHVEFLKELKALTCQIQIYLDFYTNSDIGGIEMPIHCLDLHVALSIPFGVGCHFI